MKINKKDTARILIIIVITLIIITYGFVKFVDAQETGSDIISSGVIHTEGITTIVEEYDSGLNTFEEIKKIYEIGDSSLEGGYSAFLNEKDAFRININKRNYYLIVWNITEENLIRMIFPGERQLIFGEDDVILVDINQDNKLDIRLELNAIKEDIFLKSANISIKTIIEEVTIPSGDYFELFDVTVRLAEEKIYTSRDLEAYITFENFGKGTSKIDIIYSIINEVNEEVYQGVDSKIVQTEDRVVKNFNFLELPLGKYILRTEIFYGQNQTGESEQDFEIAEVSIIDQLIGPLFFISAVIVIFILILFTRRFSKKVENEKINGK